MMNDLRAAAADVPQCGRRLQLQLLSRCFQFMPLLHILVCIVVWRSNADVNKRAIRDTMSLGHTSSYPVPLSYHRELWEGVMGKRNRGFYVRNDATGYMYSAR